MFGLDIVASIRSLGLITFRIAMILTTLRIIDGGQISSLIVCDDSDFQVAKTMAQVLLQHTAKIYCTLPTSESTSTNSGTTIIKQAFFDNLPLEFDRQTYLSVADRLKIPPTTITPSPNLPPTAIKAPEIRGIGVIHAFLLISLTINISLV